MSRYYPRSLTVGERRAKAARELRRQEKRGRVLTPVVLDGPTIARTFWGKSWCKNLEAYRDFAYRLPRGRSYVRHRSVIDLTLEGGTIQALVVGSSLYTVEVTIDALPDARWDALKADCTGAIESLVELLQGRFSEGVMARICQRGTGLFPSPDELHFSCSCPDWASLCKHVAAALYGVGARLDERPELLFALRGVEPSALLTLAITDLPLSAATPGQDQILDAGDLDIFGLELDAPSPAPEAPPSQAPASRDDVLQGWLNDRQDDGTVVTNFEKLEAVLGGLPEAARASGAWWEDRAGPLQRRWIDAGFVIKQVWVDRGWVVFEREGPRH